MLVTHNNFFHFTTISALKVLNRIVLNDYKWKISDDKLNNFEMFNDEKK